MGEFIAVFLFFIVTLLGFLAALEFSKFKGESHDECEDQDSCIFKKIGLKKLHCDS